jgi:N-acetylglutamate synthase-like GNAT family acetyltransferase
MNKKEALDNVTFRPATIDDYSSIIKLLVSHSLPVDDILDSTIEFIIAIDNRTKIIGTIGIETKGEDGLIRSLAIDEKYKSQGIGAKLLHLMEANATILGIKGLHLLTTTASDYFLGKGFIIDRRENAPETMKETREFLGICPSSAVYMKKEL